MIVISKDHPILAVIGPSGTGKSTVVQKLSQAGLVEVTPTWTTRPPRVEEPEQAIEHRFVSDQEFDRLEAEGMFIEVVKMFDLPYRYGMPKMSVSNERRIPLIMLRASLLGKLSKHYSNALIYQIEDSLPRIVERLEARNKAGEPIGTRMLDFEQEIALGRKAADRIFVNSNIPELLSQIKIALSEDYHYDGNALKLTSI